MADWEKIKTEYITTDTSYRKLADRYGINKTQIAARASKEGWVQAREQHRDKALSKTLNAISSAQAKRAARVQTVADKILVKIETMLDKMETADSQTLRQLTAAVKDLKDIQMIRTDADMREQAARIAKLEKDAREDRNGGRAVTVVLEGELKNYAQ